MDDQGKNQLVIVCDQLRYDAISANGYKLSKTPHIDALASTGMRFTNAFTCVGLCTPARTSLLTGLYPHNHQALSNNNQTACRYMLTPDKRTFTRLLADNGYRLGYVGKWHVSTRDDPCRFGFEKYVPLSEYPKWREAAGYAWNPAFGSYHAPTGVKDDIPVEASRPHFLVDQAIELLRSYAEDPAHRSWHLRLDFHGPHLPNVIPDPYASLYAPKKFEPWGNYGDTLEGKPWVQKQQLYNWDIQDWTWEQWQPIIAKYYGEVSLLDYEIGRILAELDRLGFAENTIVVCTADHGDMNAAHGMYDKGYSMYDEVYHVPLIVRWPGKTPPGSVCDAFVNHFCDLMPTLLEAAGLPAPRDIDGHSLVPLLEGRLPSDWRQEMYAEFHGMQWGLYPQRMIRNNAFKFVFNFQDPNELYDLKRDPWEVHNVYRDPQYAAVREEFIDLLYRWNQRTNDALRTDWIQYQL